MEIGKTKIRIALGILATACTATVAGAQSFPDGPITWVVNWSAGGGQDTTSRLVAEGLSEELGVAIAVENYDGAGGLAGMRVLADADADGYARTTIATHRLMTDLFMGTFPRVPNADGGSPQY